MRIELSVNGKMQAIETAEVERTLAVDRERAGDLRLLPRRRCDRGRDCERRGERDQLDAACDEPRHEPDRREASLHRCRPWRHAVFLWPEPARRRVTAKPASSTRAGARKTVV